MVTDMDTAGTEQPCPDIEARIGQARRLLEQASALLIAAGAGMGVDSGLPDFRGSEGFWRAYPALGRRGLRFTDVASPHTFIDNPALAWGFYGHRLKLYRNTTPHDGYRLLLDTARRMPEGAFVFTSNVDGQFQQAGFARHSLYECHGSIHHLQCLHGCTGHIWPADLDPVIDDEHCLWLGPLPACPACGGLARPNILMFGDADWLSSRSARQAARLRDWLATTSRLLVIELGAGTAVPTVRQFSHSLHAPVLRINVRDPDLPVGTSGVGLPLGALDALRRICHA